MRRRACSVIEVGSDRFKVPEILFNPGAMLQVRPYLAAPRAAPAHCSLSSAAPPLLCWNARLLRGAI